MRVVVTGVRGYIGSGVAEASRRAGREVLDAGKAARLLGWRPRHSSLVDQAEACFEPWKAWLGEAITTARKQAQALAGAG